MRVPANGRVFLFDSKIPKCFYELFHWQSKLKENTPLGGAGSGLSALLIGRRQDEFKVFNL